MKKGTEYIGYVEKVDFPNKGVVRLTSLVVQADKGTETDGVNELRTIPVPAEDAEKRVVVKGVIMGQTIRLRVLKVRPNKNKAEGMLLSVVKASEDEVEPLCPLFGSCGGCAYQTLPYEKQLALKEMQVRKMMDEVIQTPYEFLPIRRSPVCSGYRNKMEFSFGDEYKGGPLALGLHKRGSFYDVLTTDSCSIVHDDYNRIVRCVLELARETGLPYFHKITHIGYFRHLVVRRAQKTGEILVHLITTSQGGEAEKPFLERLTKELIGLPLEGTIAGIIHSRNDQLADAVASEGTTILYGKDYFYEELLGLRFRITPFSFFQTNSLGAEVLYQTAREFIGDTKEKLVFDLYSGTGTIAQIAASVAKKVIGVEIVAEAVEAANENARQNGLSNCEFIAGDVLKVIDTILDRPDLIILDPPREGIAPKALNKIVSYGVERIVYISCKPTSLQNDLLSFQEQGYRVEKVCPVDMFPGTVHVETVVLLVHQKVDEYMYVDYEPQNADYLKRMQGTATYREIHDWVKEKYGANVTNLNIAQVKDKCGFEKRENYNLGAEGHRVPQVTPEKEKMILEAFKHFRMI